MIKMAHRFVDKYIFGLLFFEASPKKPLGLGVGAVWKNNR